MTASDECVRTVRIKPGGTWLWPGSRHKRVRIAVRDTIGGSRHDVSRVRHNTDPQIRCVQVARLAVRYAQRETGFVPQTTIIQVSRGLWSDKVNQEIYDGFEADDHPVVDTETGRFVTVTLTA